MRFLSVLLGVVCSIVALSFTVWVGRYAQVGEKPADDKQVVVAPPQPPNHAAEKSDGQSKDPDHDHSHDGKEGDGHDHDKDEDKVKPKEEPAPDISASGPHPKAVVDQTTYNFGVMETKTTGEHVFIVRNEGEAPLSLRRGTSTCMCTRFDILKKEVLPGESAEIKVDWKPATENKVFEQSLVLKTNDPKQTEIRLSVTGSVETRLVMSPVSPWTVTYHGKEPHTVYGNLLSKLLKEVEIIGVDVEHPELMKVNLTPLSPDDELIKDKGNLCGYKIEVILSPEIPAGPINERATIRTSVSGHEQITIELTGNRTGPIRIIPTFGVRWNQEKSFIILGQFPSTDGKKAILTMIVGELDEEFTMSDIEISPTTMKFSIEKDTKPAAAGHQRFILTFEVPANGPIQSRTRENPATVKVRTNHPRYPEMTFKLEYIAL
ncbi:MAG: DUF1573 domain-containing protein [Planctomycetaceae bacterium]